MFENDSEESLLSNEIYCFELKRKDNNSTDFREQVPPPMSATPIDGLICGGLVPSLNVDEIGLILVVGTDKGIEFWDIEKNVRVSGFVAEGAEAASIIFLAPHCSYDNCFITEHSNGGTGKKKNLLFRVVEVDFVS